MIGATRIRSKKVRENQYREGYAGFLKRKGVKLDGGNNVEHMLKQGKWVMVESAREVCGLLRVWEKKSKLCVVE